MSRHQTPKRLDINSLSLHPVNLSQKGKPSSSQRPGLLAPDYVAHRSVFGLVAHVNPTEKMNSRGRKKLIHALRLRGRSQGQNSLSRVT